MSKETFEVVCGVFNYCLTILFLYQKLGPKYQYMLGSNDSGLMVMRYNVFNGGFERCFINKHRIDTSYLKKYDRSANDETLYCVRSYEFTEQDKLGAMIDQMLVKTK